MKFCLVYDFISPNGFIFNGLNPVLLPKYHEYGYRFDKQVNSELIRNFGLKIGTEEQEFFHNSKKHVSDITSNDLNKNIQFLYYIYTAGDFETTLGANDSYNKDKSFLDFMSYKAKNLLKYDNFKIVIYLGLEHEISYNHIRRLYLSCQENNISLNKIYIVSNHLSPVQNEQKFLDKLKLKLPHRLNFINFNQQLTFKGEELENKELIQYFQNEDDLEIKNKKNFCLILNRRLRSHRMCLMSLLAHDNKMDDNLISFDLTFGYDESFEDYINQEGYLFTDIDSDSKDFLKLRFTQEFKNKILNGFQKIKKIEKLALDVDDYEAINGRSFEVDDKSLYQDSYFSVVTETEFFSERNNYSTEKLLKPIQQMHPFVVMGTPGLLKELKSYGFKTFSDFWDESYDDELRPSFRFIKLYNLILELLNKSTSEWDEMMISIKPILIYNRNVLKSFGINTRKSLIEDNLLNILENEFIEENPKLLQTKKAREIV